VTTGMSDDVKRMWKAFRLCPVLRECTGLKQVKIDSSSPVQLISGCGNGAFVYLMPRA